MKKRSRLALIAAFGLASLHATAVAEEVDKTNPDSVKAYRDGFRIGAYKRCMADVEQRVTVEGKSFGDRERAVAEKFCGCSVDGIAALIADAQIEALKTVMTDPALKPDRQQIVTACAKAAEQVAN